jgi:hypothetical protein
MWTASTWYLTALSCLLSKQKKNMCVSLQPRMPKIFIVGTACTGITEAYESLCRRSQLSCCNEKHTDLLIECVVRKTIPVESVIGTYCKETATIDKSHLNLWVVEELSIAFPDAIFVATTRNVNLVVSQMLRIPSITDWCLHYSRMGIEFPSAFLGAQLESDYQKLNLKERCKARVLSHLSEIERLSQCMSKERFFVLNFDDKAAFDRGIDEVVMIACSNSSPSYTEIAAPTTRAVSLAPQTLSWHKKNSDLKLQSIIEQTPASVGPPPPPSTKLTEKQPSQPVPWQNKLSDLKLQSTIGKNIASVGPSVGMPPPPSTKLTEKQPPQPVPWQNKLSDLKLQSTIRKNIASVGPSVGMPPPPSTKLMEKQPSQPVPWQNKLSDLKLQSTIRKNIASVGPSVGMPPPPSTKLTEKQPPQPVPWQNKLSDLQLQSTIGKNIVPAPASVGPQVGPPPPPSTKLMDWQNKLSELKLQSSNRVQKATIDYQNSESCNATDPDHETTEPIMTHHIQACNRGSEMMRRAQPVDQTPDQKAYPIHQPCQTPHQTTHQAHQPHQPAYKPHTIKTSKRAQTSHHQPQPNLTKTSKQPLLPIYSMKLVSVSPLDRKLDPKPSAVPLVKPKQPALDISVIPIPVEPGFHRKDYPADLKFYWINLDRATHRKERMEQEFAKRNISNRRVTAFDGQTFDFRPFIESKIPHAQLMKQKFEISTTLSHLKALHCFVQDGDDIAIICEDDLSFEYEGLWRKSLHELLKDAPENWQVLQLGLTINVPKEWHNIMALGKTYLQRKAHWYSALAYAVKRDHAIRILTHYSIPCDAKTPFSARFRILNTDQTQSERIVIGTGPNTYLVYPPVFTYPSNNDSFIHPNHLRMHESSKNMIAKAYLNNRL